MKNRILFIADLEINIDSRNVDVDNEILIPGIRD